MKHATLPEASQFAKRLSGHPAERLESFAEAEIMSGLPSIFSDEEDVLRFQQHVASALGVSDSASGVLIVGSAKTGFSLNPDSYFVPFHETSDIDVVVIHERLFDQAWHGMLAWDYLTIKNRARPEQRWLWRRRVEIWSGWCHPPGWRLRERGGIELSFPDALKQLRDFSYRWFSVFRSLSRYRHHPEIPRHKVTARLYRTRTHVAMYHAAGLRTLRSRISTSE